jgi:hypothetical protein
MEEEQRDKNFNQPKDGSKRIRYTPFSRQILRATAEMFRQHANLYEQQAAILERIATRIHAPSFGRKNDRDIIEEVEEKVPSPESLQRKCLLETGPITLAIKSYEAVLQLQKRVDKLERLMKQNGIKGLDQYKSSRTKRIVWQYKLRKTMGNVSKDSFAWFKHTYGPVIANELKDKTNLDVYGHLLKVWSTMNPHQRLPYVEMARKRSAREEEQEDPTEHDSQSGTDVTPQKPRRSKRIKSSLDDVPNELKMTANAPTTEEQQKDHVESLVPNVSSNDL